jgi:hypothetical protein
MFKNQEEWMRWLLDGNTVRRDVEEGIGLYHLSGGFIVIKGSDIRVALNKRSWRDEKVVPKKKVLKSIWQLRKEYPYAEFNRAGDLGVRDFPKDPIVIPSRKLYLFDGKTNADDWPEEFYTEIEGEI